MRNQWAESQIKYSTIYNNIQPLREEVARLEEEAKVVRGEKENIEQEVTQLEKSIARYKTDYASLIRDVEALKAEMEAVTTKVQRAESLLQSLGHESERWAKSSEAFAVIMKCLVGDGLLMAAFLTFSGFFDFNTRTFVASLPLSSFFTNTPSATHPSPTHNTGATMIQKWKDALELLGIDFREDLGIVETLCTAAERLSWQSQGLHNDQLSKCQPCRNWDLLQLHGFVHWFLL